MAENAIAFLVRLCLNYRETLDPPGNEVLESSHSKGFIWRLFLTS